MDIFLDVLLDSLIDTAKLLPVLLIVYFLIELLEYKNVLQFEKSNLLTGKFSPVVGACFGSVPQCGFSVISAELYSKRKISISALIAVFIATSDEALPIMIANYKAIPSLIVLLLTKLILAIVCGYLTGFVYKFAFKQKKPMQKASGENISTFAETESITSADAEYSATGETESVAITAETQSISADSTDTEKVHEHLDEQVDAEEKHIHACCHHDIENQHKFNWKHPLIHCIKIAIYIFVINIVMGLIVALIGEDKIEQFLSTNSALQPLFALVVGLIPNCASSVILTEMYIDGMLTFGSIVTGLSVNAGLGLIVLFKENKKIKENLFIVVMLIVLSLLFGYALNFVPFNFLRIWE